MSSKNLISSYFSGFLLSRLTQENNQGTLPAISAWRHPPLDNLLLFLIEQSLHCTSQNRATFRVQAFAGDQDDGAETLEDGVLQKERDLGSRLVNSHAMQVEFIFRFKLAALHLFHPPWDGTFVRHVST